MSILAIALIAAVSPDLEAKDTDEARAAYNRGRAFYKKGRYARAINALQKAYAIKPHPALLRYIGDAYYKLNDAQKAIEHYKLYLTEAPQAADRAKIKGKVQQLELILGSGDEGTPRSGGAPASSGPGARGDNPASAASSDVMAPTGEDREVPAALRGPIPNGKQGSRRDGGTSAMTVLKWISTGVAVGGLALGITFNRLAASKANDLEDAVQQSGNDDGRSPKVPFGQEHFQMQQDYKRNQIISLVGFIAGGVAAGTAAALFVLDRKKPEQRRRRSGSRVSVAPALGNGLYGLSGQLSF